MNRKNTQRAAIREYLASHPLSSTREIVDALHLEFHSTSGNLTNLHSKGEVVRERDEFGVFRYALKETKEVKEESTPTQEETNIGKAHSNAQILSLFANRMCAIAAYLKDNPNKTTQEIADAIEEPLIAVGACLIFWWKECAEGVKYVHYVVHTKYLLQRSVAPDGAIRYSCVPRDEPQEKKLVKVKTLDDFTPREMFAHLKKLGFKWNPNALYHEEVTVKRNYVEFDKI